ncbi:MAG TPA: histidine phosphatase family protein [Ktedonobacterales bacterium]|nr:histidine phosphatase family protein [Ktedonobacterales bacterium]
MSTFSTTQPETLILVKHVRPIVVPDLPAARWALGDAGRASCEPLARALALWRPDSLIASEEPKAAETARLTAERLGVPWRTAHGLHEHDRAGAPFFADETALAAAVEALFAQPDARVYGRETASEALRRFTAALDAALTEQAGRSVAVVAHGTVIALYVASQWGMSAREGYDLWRRLGLPSLVVTRAPGLTGPLVVERVG